MNKKVLVIIAWVIGGFVIGWYTLINVQLYLSIKEVSRVNKNQDEHITEIERVLGQAFGDKAPGNQSKPVNNEVNNNENNQPKK